MNTQQLDREMAYLSAMSIVNTLRSNGLLLESEVRQIASILAERFSSKLAQITPELA